MRMIAQAVRLLGVATLVWVTSSCTGVLQSNVPDISTDITPPQKWESAVEFGLADPVFHSPNVNFTTRVEFTDAAGRRSVTNADLFEASNGQVRTPWYRLRPSDAPVTIRVTVKHPNGVESKGEYSLPVQKDYFYMVSTSVFTRRPTPAGLPDWNSGLIGFPLNPNAQAAPGDSLWIGSNAIPRICFQGAVCD